MDIVGHHFAQHFFLVAALPPRNADALGPHFALALSLADRIFTGYGSSYNAPTLATIN